MPFTYLIFLVALVGVLIFFSPLFSLLIIKDSYLLIKRFRSSELSRSNSSSSSKSSVSFLSDELSFFWISYFAFLDPLPRSLRSCPFRRFSMVESLNDSFWAFYTLLPFLEGDSPLRGRPSRSFLLPEFLVDKRFNSLLAEVGLSSSYSKRSSSTSSMKWASPLWPRSFDFPLTLGSSVFHDENLLLELVFGIYGSLVAIYCLVYVYDPPSTSILSKSSSTSLIFICKCFNLIVSFSLIIISTLYSYYLA